MFKFFKSYFDRKRKEKQEEIEKHKKELENERKEIFGKFCALSPIKEFEFKTCSSDCVHFLDGKIIFFGNELICHAPPTCRLWEVYRGVKWFV